MRIWWRIFATGALLSLLSADGVALSQLQIDVHKSLEDEWYAWANLGISSAVFLAAIAGILAIWEPHRSRSCSRRP